MKKSKDLLRLEKDYFNKFGSNDSKETIIKKLLEKPKKPEFKNFPRSERLYII